jgi:hypothetical protein
LEFSKISKKYSCPETQIADDLNVHIVASEAKGCGRGCERKGNARIGGEGKGN